MSGSIKGIFDSAGAVVSDIGAYIGSGYTAAGEEAAAQGFQKAADIAYQDSEDAQAAGKLQQIQTARQVYQVGGAGIATAAAHGLKMEGSAASILSNTAAQGALAHQLIGTQTQINVNSYITQMQSDQAEEQQAEDAAKAAKASGVADLIGAGIQTISTISQIAAAASG